jgi:hypothetical protein
MAEGTKQAWEDVGDRFAAFGRMVAEHYRQRGEQQGAPPTEEDRRKLEEALATVTRQLDQAFTAFGDTLRDPEAKESLKQAARSVGDALTVTFTVVGQEVRKRVAGSDEGSGETGGDAPHA